MTSRQWQFLFSYSPSLYLPDVELGIAPLATQTASGSAIWHNRSWRISASEAASYGQINSALVFPQLAAAPTTGTGPPAMTGQPGQPGQPTMTGQPAPAQPAGIQRAATPTTINFGSLNTSASIALLSVRRTVITVSGGHTLSGGLTEADEAVLPKQYGGHVEASVAYRVSRRDGLITSVSAQDTFTTGACAPLPGQTIAPVAQAGALPAFCHEESPSIQVQETVRHQLSPAAVMSVGVGVAAAIVESDDLAQELAILPVVVASLSERFDAQGTNLMLSAQMSPLVDPRTGFISQRASATLAVSKTFTRTLRIIGSANMLQSVPYPVSDPNPITALGGGLEARITLDRQAILGVGEQTFWQNQEGYGMLVSTIGYVSLTVLAPTLRF